MAFDGTEQLTPFKNLLNAVLAESVGQTKSGTVVVTTTTLSVPVAVPVLFGADFGATPRVVVSVTSTVPDNRAVGVSSISSTGFTVSAVTTGGSPGAITVQWIATIAAA